MSEKHISNKEMLESKGWKEIEKGVYVSQRNSSDFKNSTRSRGSAYWKNKFEQFKEERASNSKR